MATESELSYDEAQQKLTDLEGDIQTAEREHARFEAERTAGERDVARVVERCGELGVKPEQLDMAIGAQAKKVAGAVKAAEEALAGVDEAEEEDTEDVAALLEDGDDE